MPGMDRSGPMGTGPTGRGLGPCGSGPGERWIGRGFRRGGWFGRWRTPAEMNPAEEKDNLQNQKGWLESQLEAIGKRLGELDK